jgi:hypothetical protein
MSINTNAERLAAKLDKTGDCWLFTGGHVPKGYGCIWHSIERRQVYAHRLAYELASGAPIPEGLVVMHSCDTPACCRPEHLSLGTTADNLADMRAKGRANDSVKSRGSSHYAAMDEATARAIFAAEGSQQAIADRFGVHQTSVSRIKRGLHWSLLTP